MKIVHHLNKPPTPLGAPERRIAPQGGPTAAPAPSAKVELSSAARLAGDGEGTFDAEKVARMSRAIGDGSFKINAETIADKLLANARELLTKKPG